jgi:hypothetical protein
MWSDRVGMATLVKVVRKLSEVAALISFILKIKNQLREDIGNRVSGSRKAITKVSSKKNHFIFQEQKGLSDQRNKDKGQRSETHTEVSLYESPCQMHDAL